MPVLVIPSIDVHQNKTVRVVQGIPELNCPEYKNDPVEMAMIWRAENAKIIHVVDFDHIHNYSNINHNIIEEICDSVIIPVELGGGIRNLKDADEAFSLGVYRLVIGSLAYNDENEFIKIIEKYGPKKISAAIDVIDDEVVVRRRRIKTGIDPLIYAKRLAELGIERLIVTDVKTNGMMLGPNIELSEKTAEASGCKVTLSGGISGLEDLLRVNAATDKGIDSVIIGRALYENKFSCQKIWRVAESGLFN
ncbi:MAG: 1-(5-phosphoribosyl)-5-[(5-phosphoribosylamino)methylideneamino] imidazole-4-carboxamide isomerase [Melioribacteraceae bacterium]|nr:1-(5-phosphoribosyl)-5-[(5-phosphoribosylamino)methylideneamino] imidazole-4-carboxamide isomerase [Melioribacteraceae bacterium]MCF8353450.1 1-(5-phosphoribosyl)-5-[(5-phosphoribosylamino)methylideneamino] imidazole-4-carboxamide isomerase [Melioribacteraceae bacterium]MCF8393938.1 1-(5-phosphoribosyl)-5-[(5-phosphoribosylamino)methylideneamino] imidazole-4-carboxamide isomerase [Melioribacteraceae bacterium]MCF8419011.1 1-(5-phosphoribosyl)-5-[(5-phosphoribosylamino)methylideneamino] imidaz